jgi:hypothetical protein
MKNFSFFSFAVLLVPAIFLSCRALPANHSASQSWVIPKTKLEKTGTTLTLITVKADRGGGWDSIENEAAALAPLYFWDRGYRVIAVENDPVNGTPNSTPSYAATIQLREREFNRSWRTKRSLAVEVRIWAYEDIFNNGKPENGPGLYEQKLPAAVGRVIVMGEKSFSSSNTTGRLLSKAIKKAARQLAIYERKLSSYEKAKGRNDA